MADDNHDDYAEFHNELEDEYTFDAHWPPGVEIGEDVAVEDVEDEDYQEPLELERDCGSGSRAEDGKREILEDRNIMGEENEMMGSYAMYGPTEVGCDEAVGAAAHAVKKAAVAVKTAPPHIAAKHVAAAHKAVAHAQYAIASGPYASAGPMEIGGDYKDRHGGARPFKRYSHEATKDMPEDPGGAFPHGAAIGAAIAHAATAVNKATAAVKHAPPHVAAQHVAAAHHAVAKAHHVAVTSGPYASHGAMEIGGTDMDDEIGAVAKKAVAKAEQAVKKAAVAVKTAPPHVAAQHVAAAHRATQHAAHAIASGPYASHGAMEIGAAAAADRPGSELGAGLYPVDGASELGNTPGEGGYIAKYGQTEIGDDEIGDDELPQTFETFMMEPHRIGDDEMGAGFEGWEPVADSLGAGLYPVDGASELGAEQAKIAVAKIVEKARDNRKPAPPMKVVDVNAPIDEDDFLSDIVIGAAAKTGTDQFPLLTELLVRAGSGMPPRVVRVDTEDSYKAFRAQQSPEIRALNAKLEKHIHDPHAHEQYEDNEDIDDDISSLVHLGEEVKAAEVQKRVDLWMPKRFDGNLESWREGDMVCASMALPSKDGEVRICTSFEPVRKCVDEMARHASETDVPAESFIGVLPAMGCVLGAGTVLKEMAAAAPAILARPEAKVKLPFVVRIEPKTSPNLAALTMLAAAAKTGNTQAQSEWQKLASLSAPQVNAAMLEAIEVAKTAMEG